MCDLSTAAARVAEATVPLVLAAGASSRMGTPKEFLEFQGVSCLSLVLSACAGVGLVDPIVVTRQERLAQVKAHLATLQPAPQVVVNPRPELGQTSSLRAGLALLPSAARAFLIFPVDHPLITADDIARLLEQMAAASPSTDVVAPSFDYRRGHPVLVHARLAPWLLALAPSESARQVLSAPSTVTSYVEYSDDRVLTDMDTPEAYARCLERYTATVKIS